MAERRPSETLPTAPGEKDGTFVMTETASTAFPMDPLSPPTTADGMGIVGIASVQRDGGGSATARHNKLLLEAEMRAEHQAQARTTMLDLAAALDESNARRHELASQLSQEQRTSADLRKQVDAIQRQLDKLEEEEEKRKAKILVDKALKSGNNVFFGMLLAKSREAFPTELFGEGKGGEAKEYKGTGPRKTRAPGSRGSAAGSSRSSRRSKGSKETTSEGGEGEGKGGIQFGAVDVEHFSAEEDEDDDDELSQEPAGVSDAAAKSRRASSWDFLVDRGETGDKVTFEWSFKLWANEIKKIRAARADEIAELERKRAEEERKRQIEEEKRKAVEAMKKIAERLEEALNASKETIAQHEKRQQELEKELQLEREKMASREGKHKEEVRAIQADLNRTQQELANVKGQLKDLQNEYDGALESLRKADQQFANERRQLQDTIRNITSELQEAMVLAKHMRETALKAKREAAGSVSPSKFAELIGQLEEMKSQLSALWKDCMKETETNDWLRRQLDKNKRQLELERQFLPLLHKVRGPVGPKMPGGQTALDGPKRKDATANPQATAMPPIAGQASPNKIRMGQSQSLGALGGPLGGPGGGRQSAGQQDANRFTSRDFASSNGFSAAGSLLA
mmetsp:Transcript_145854/g.254459  ORF Transcript_145854/g.254459 Transcript_145854/m.254459 type:complete len:627 (-) Transcript_145854:166-2046(-)